MKIGIITRHSVPNYGSLLQSYATQQLIKKLGHDSMIINYTRYDERGKHIASSLLKNKKWNSNFILKNIYLLVQKPNFKIMYNKFKKFRKNFLIETEKEYGNIEELQLIESDFDIFCSGSDQIWGNIGSDIYDKTYFLDFVREKKCISYASSFGKEVIPSELEQNLMNLLKKYSHILVRELSAQKIITAIGIPNVHCVLDPTLLLEAKQWEKLANKSHHIVHKDYILVYQIHNNKLFEKYLKKLSKIQNLSVIRISANFHHCFRYGKFVYLPNQYDFLSYIKNAKYVISDSFHATVFSILFHKKFVTISPTNNTVTRIENLLKLLEIQDRLINSFDNYDVIVKEIDYSKTDKLLEKERKKSIKLFKMAIEK